MFYSDLKDLLLLNNNIVISHLKAELLNYEGFKIE